MQSIESVISSGGGRGARDDGIAGGEEEGVEKRAKREHTNEDLLLKLEAFLQLPAGSLARFKSTEQQDALRLAVERRYDALIVLPTGGGKSVLFMPPCYLDAVSVTVVIVPLVALQHDLLTRCQRCGIDGVLWADRERPGVRIVIASAEHVTTEAYSVLVRSMAVDRWLARIVVDEAHLVPLWASFRTSMLGLTGCIRSGGVTVPVLIVVCWCHECRPIALDD
jgi:superfamily II DNA helicase RecQ